MFNELNLSEWILQALEQKSFTVPTEIQQQCIPLIAEGKDVFGRSKTGSGKTFAFGLPAIDKVDAQLKGIQILAICPTRELALQVTDELRKITQFKEGCGIAPIYGGADIERQIRALKNAKIVVGTPGRLMDHMRRNTLKLHNLKMVVLDEADEMLNMGFREDIESILKATPGQRQTVMFSATMPPAIRAITKEYMKEPQYVELGDLNSTIDEIDQSYVRVSRNGKKTALVELFKKLMPERSIVFCNTKRMVDDIKNLLNGKGINCLALHGDMRQSERRRVMESIKSHKVATLVATDVAARGIDIEDVTYIFNYDLPNDVEYYIHRIGRTARAGKSGKAITLINTKEQLVQLEQFRIATKSLLTEHYLAENLSVFSDLQTKKVTPPAPQKSTFAGRSQVVQNKNKPQSKPFKGSIDKRKSKAEDAPNAKKKTFGGKKAYEKKSGKGVDAKRAHGENSKKRVSENNRNAENRPSKFAYEDIDGYALPVRRKVSAASYFKNRNKKGGNK